jgi:hypothetical protein
MSLLDTASLIVTPNGYKEGKLYSVIPSDGSGDMSVGRATTATRVNSAGLVELVPYNLYSKSNDFSTWGNIVNVTVTPNYTTSPDGTQNASRFQASAYGFIFNLGTTATVGEPITISVYAKRNDNGTQSVGFFQDDSAIEYAFSLTNEWQIFEYTTNFLNDYIGIAANSGADISIYGFQIVQGANAKDYQKTETRLNIPRLDYSNGTCPSLLVEPQRTNTILNSVLSGTTSLPTSWNFSTSTGTSAPTPSIYSQIGQAYSFTTAATRQAIFQNQSYTSGSTYSFSVFVESVTGSIRVDNVIFQTVAGTQTFYKDGVLINASDFIESGHRYTTLMVASSTTTAQVRIGNGAGGATTGTVVLSMPQLELGSYPTSYIPTQAATVTRNADVISKTGIADLIGQTEGVVFLDYLYTELDINGNIPITIGLNGTNAAYIFFRNNGVIRCDFIVGGASQGRIDTSSSYAVKGTRYKIAFAYKANDFAVYINGQLIGTDNIGAITGLSDLFLNYPYNSGYNATSNINAVALYKTRLTNAELATLTTI